MNPFLLALALPMMLLLACASPPPTDCDLLANRHAAACPCRDHSSPATDGVTCRPDQDIRIEWEPPSVASRFENEDRVGGVVVCECRP